MNQSSLNTVHSWVIREKATGRVLFETFDPKKVAALNTERYEAISIADHLAEISRLAKLHRTVK